MSEIDQLTASSERFTSSECILRCAPSGLSSRESFARAFAQTRAFTFTLLLQLLLNTTRARARAHSPDPQAREPLLLLFNTTRTTSGPPSTRAAIAVDGGVTDGPRLRQHIVTYTIGGTCRYGEATTSELLCLPTNAESNAHIFTGKVSISHT